MGQLLVCVGLLDNLVADGEQPKGGVEARLLLGLTLLQCGEHQEGNQVLAQTLGSYQPLPKHESYLLHGLGKLDADKCRIIWKTPTYADYNWTAHPDLEKAFGEGFIEKLQKALTDIDDPDLLKALTRSKIITAKNEDFDGIVEVAKQLGLLN